MIIETVSKYDQYNIWCEGGGSMKDGRGGPGKDSLENLKFQVLGNAISALLRQSQRVLISHFLKLKCHSFS